VEKELSSVLEWTLREYPRKAEELDRLDRYIEQCCRASAWAGDADGAPGSRPVSIEERVLEAKEQNTRRQWITGFIERIDKALLTLSAKEITFVNCYYWENIPIEHVALELGIKSRAAYYMKERILSKLGPLLLPFFVYGGGGDVAL